nr:MAG TPA: hypothetical protein [Caudoviricetes sp.]
MFSNVQYFKDLFIVLFFYKGKLLTTSGQVGYVCPSLTIGGLCRAIHR